MSGPIVVLSGGVGGAQFIRGLVEVVPPEDIVAIVNTGDDLELWGLQISPDLDTNLYTLACAVEPAQKWGRANESFHCLEEVSRYGMPDWFRLGDRDLATHLFRTQRLREGAPLSQVSRELCRAWGLRLSLLPMSDDAVRTNVRTDDGELSFQDYFVRRRARDAVRGVRFAGAEASRPAPGVLDALATARAIVIAPSNPILSVQPILAVPGVREALRVARAPRVAVSPLIGSQAVKGPTVACLEGLGFEASNRGIAAAYQGLVDRLVVDTSDEADLPGLGSLGLRAIATPTLMKDVAAAADLARAVLRIAQ